MPIGCCFRPSLWRFSPEPHGYRRLRRSVGASRASLSIAVAVLWQGVEAPPPATNLWPAVGAVMRLPDELHVYLPFVAFSSLAVSLVAALRLRVGRDLPDTTAGFYALAATVTPLTTLTVAYLRITQFDGSIPFALFGVVLALCLPTPPTGSRRTKATRPPTAPHLAPAPLPPRPSRHSRSRSSFRSIAATSPSPWRWRPLAPPTSPR